MYMNSFNSHNNHYVYFADGETEAQISWKTKVHTTSRQQPWDLKPELKSVLNYCIIQPLI